MNPTVKIGRYEIPIGSVVGVYARERSLLARLWFKLLRRIPSPEYMVVLAGGVRLRFTEQEKLRLDEERATHEAVMQVMGMVASIQANQRPSR